MIIASRRAYCSKTMTPADTEADPAVEKRRHRRAPLSLLVQYRSETFDDFLTDYSEDISLGGMFIRTDTPRPVGSMIYLQFSLEDGSVLLEGLGKVVHVSDGSGGRPVGMGVQFESFDDASRGFIEELVASRLAELDAGADAG